jgi:hypothetical protein
MTPYQPSEAIALHAVYVAMSAQTRLRLGSPCPTRDFVARRHFSSTCLDKDHMVLPTTELEGRVSRLEDLVNQLYRLDQDRRRDINELIEITNGIEIMVNVLRDWTPWLITVWRWWHNGNNDHSSLPSWIPSGSSHRSIFQDP